MDKEQLNLYATIIKKDVSDVVVGTAKGAYDLGHGFLDNVIQGIYSPFAMRTASKRSKNMDMLNDNSLAYDFGKVSGILAGFFASAVALNKIMNTYNAAPVVLGTLVATNTVDYLVRVTQRAKEERRIQELTRGAFLINFANAEVKKLLLSVDGAVKNIDARSNNLKK